jgi:hypothetical protein
MRRGDLRRSGPIAGTPASVEYIAGPDATEKPVANVGPAGPYRLAAAATAAANVAAVAGGPTGCFS